MKKNTTDSKMGDFYNPDMADSILALQKIAEEYTPFVEAHKNMPYRAQTVSYRVLARYLEFLKGIAPAIALKATGKENAALAEFERFADDFGKYEIEMEGNYDHTNVIRSFNRIFKVITVLFDAE